MKITNNTSHPRINSNNVQTAAAFGAGWATSAATNAENMGATERVSLFAVAGILGATSRHYGNKNNTESTVKTVAGLGAGWAAGAAINSENMGATERISLLAVAGILGAASSNYNNKKAMQPS